MLNITEPTVSRTAIALSIFSLLGAAGCSAMGSDSGMGMKDRPMAGMMGQEHAMPPGMKYASDTLF